MQIADFLSPENVFVDVAPASKASVLARLAELAGRRLGRPGDEILELLAARERLGSTGIGDGVAIPHARVPGLRQPVGLLARLASPVPFEAIDDVPVDMVFVLLMPEEGTGAHLNVLACIARQLRASQVREAMRLAGDAAQLYVAAVTEPAAAPGRA